MTDLRPRKPQRLGIGALLALGAHAVLILGFVVHLNWRSETPTAVSAELWSAVPQSAAPAAVEAPPPPPPPPPAPTPAPAPPPPAPDRDAEIALEKKQREAERREQERERVEKKEAADKKREAEKLARDKAEKREKTEAAAKAEKAEQKEAQRRKDEQRLAALAEQSRQDQLKRLQSQLGGVAGATGGPNASGSALRDSGPSASYAGRVVAKVKPNIVFADEVAGNPVAEVEVRAAPDGTILGRRLAKSSGVKEWDEAVLRAIDRTATLPRDVDGRVPSPMLIALRPRE